MPEQSQITPKKILIIEDTREIRLSLVAAFEEEDFEVFSAETGRAGLVEFVRNNPDLVITDLRMPDLQGSDVVARIRKVSDTPIIVLSAIGDEQSKVHCLELGADDYVVKGIGIDELLARVSRHLKRIRRQVAAPQTSPPPAPEDSTNKSREPVGDSSIRVLLVGPQDSEQRKLAVNLKDLGHNLGYAQDYDAALKNIGTKRPDLLIINTKLPGSSALRLANYVKQKVFVPVILVAENVSPVLKAKSRILAVADTISPSIADSDLQMRIGWALLAKDRLAEKRRRAQQLKKMQDELKETG